MEELSALNLKVAFYSKLNQMNNDTDILIIDSYGDSLKFYNAVKYVFVGKSLAKTLIMNSGQNPIEAARLGCKIFHGPSIENFTEIYKFLKSLKITKQIQNNEDLNQSLVEEFESNKTYSKQIIEQIDSYGQNVLNNVMNEIKKYINI